MNLLITKYFFIMSDFECSNGNNTKFAENYKKNTFEFS